MMFEIDFYSQTDEAITQLAHQKLHTSTEDWEKQVWQFIADWFNPAITTVQVYTSGSTGAPKAITHSKVAMQNSAAATCAALQLQHGNRALLCLPVNKISGIMMVVRSITHKMRLLCIKPSVIPLKDLPVNASIDFAAFTPMQFHPVTTNHAIFKKAEAIQKIILGGEDVRAELLHSIQSMQNQIYITFGMTETISHIALKKLNGANPDINFKTLPGIDISIDERNCLLISAPALGQPHLQTNDVIKLVNKNEFQWLGRIDNVINTGGVKIYPEEIEQQLTGFIETPFFITSLPNAVTGEKLAIALEVPEINQGLKQTLQQAFNKLEKLHRPKLLLLIPQFAHTGNGKIMRRQSLDNIADKMQL